MPGRTTNIDLTRRSRALYVSPSPIQSAPFVCSLARLGYLVYGRDMNCIVVDEALKLKADLVLINLKEFSTANALINSLRSNEALTKTNLVVLLQERSLDEPQQLHKDQRSLILRHDTGQPRFSREISYLTQVTSIYRTQSYQQH